jgi:hypothetical protein
VQDVYGRSPEHDVRLSGPCLPCCLVGSKQISGRCLAARVGRYNLERIVLPRWKQLGLQISCDGARDDDHIQRCRLQSVRGKERLGSRRLAAFSRQRQFSPRRSSASHTVNTQSRSEPVSLAIPKDSHYIFESGLHIAAFSFQDMNPITANWAWTSQGET